MINDELYSYSHAVANYGIHGIKDWFQKHPSYRFKFIIDADADEDKISLQERKQYYWSVKMFGVVMNPWARMVFFQEAIKNSTHILPEELLAKFKYENLEEFIMSFPANQHPRSTDWYVAGTNQIEWFTYTNEEGNLIDIDFLIRAENFEEDILKASASLISPIKIEKKEAYPVNYQSLYNKEMKDAVESIFYKDVEYYKYKF